MGQFRYLGATYFGLDPQQVTFQRQASSDTCWAACLANAGSVLYGRPVATDQDIVRAAHLEGLKNKGLKKAHVVEMVNFVSPVSQVMQKVFRQVSKKNQTDSFEDRFALVKEMEGNLKSATPYPFMMGVRQDQEIVKHAILILAVDNEGEHYLCYDPGGQVRENRNFALAVMVGDDKGGLMVLSGADLTSMLRFVISLQRTAG